MERNSVDQNVGTTERKVLQKKIFGNKQKKFYRLVERESEKELTKSECYLFLKRKVIKHCNV